MRHFIFIISTLFLLSCGNSSAPDFKHQQADTVLTTITYAHNWTVNDYRMVTAEKIIKDTTRVEKIDSLTQKIIPVRDSFYVIALVDTARDVHGILKDSSGKVQMQNRYVYLPKELVITDHNRRWGQK